MRFGTLESDDFKTADVPCTKCTACCRGGSILLYPESGDDPDLYDKAIFARAANADLTGFWLPQREDGSGCVYLDSRKGCTIYDIRPLACRSFDCRLAYRRWGGQPTHIRNQLFRPEVFEAGRERMPSLILDERRVQEKSTESA